MSTQIEFNRECCGCQGEAILQMNTTTNQLECTGCNSDNQPVGYDFCQATAGSQNYGGFGNFVVDFFSPETIQAIGGLFGRGGSAPYDPNGTTQDSIKKQNRGLGIVIMLIVAVVIVLVVRKRKSKK